jgi:hypothetical protein
MAGRILNRRTLREQAEQAARPEAGAAEAPTGAARAAAKPKKAPASRRKPAKKPTRLRARWVLFDAAMKKVAVFDYSQRAAADAALADARSRKKGLFFLQIVKDALPEPAPAAPAVLP